MKVLVFGATGMLGHAVMKTGYRRGHALVGAARSGTDVACDVSDADAVEQVTAAAAPDLIINCAAMTDIATCEADPATAWLHNARAVALMAEAGRRHGSRLIQVSTDQFFTGDGDVRHPEEARVVLANEYARTKFAAEALVLSVPNALVVRTNILGFRHGRGKPTLAEWALDVIEHDRPATLFTDAFVSSIDCPSCADTLFDLAEHGATGRVNVASRDVFSKATLVRSMAKALDRPLTRAQDGSVHRLSVVRGDSLGLDVSRAEALLGRTMPGLQDVVAAVLSDHRKIQP